VIFENVIALMIVNSMEDLGFPNRSISSTTLPRWSCDGRLQEGREEGWAPSSPLAGGKVARSRVSRWLMSVTCSAVSPRKRSVGSGPSIPAAASLYSHQASMIRA